MYSIGKQQIPKSHCQPVTFENKNNFKSKQLKTLQVFLACVCPSRTSLAKLTTLSLALFSHIRLLYLICNEPPLSNMIWVFTRIERIAKRWISIPSIVCPADFLNSTNLRLTRAWKMLATEQNFEYRLQTLRVSFIMIFELGDERSKQQSKVQSIWNRTWNYKQQSWANQHQARSDLEEDSGSKRGEQFRKMSTELTWK